MSDTWRRDEGGKTKKKKTSWAAGFHFHMLLHSVVTAAIKRFETHPGPERKWRSCDREDVELPEQTRVAGAPGRIGLAAESPVCCV